MPRKWSGRPWCWYCDACKIDVPDYEIGVRSPPKGVDEVGVNFHRRDGCWSEKVRMRMLTVKEKPNFE